MLSLMVIRSEFLAHSFLVARLTYSFHSPVLTRFSRLIMSVFLAHFKNMLRYYRGVVRSLFMILIDYHVSLPNFGTFGNLDSLPYFDTIGNLGSLASSDRSAFLARLHDLMIFTHSRSQRPRLTLEYLESIGFLGSLTVFVAVGFLDSLLFIDAIYLFDSIPLSGTLENLDSLANFDSFKRFGSLQTIEMFS